MQILYDRSYGVVPLHNDGTVTRVLLVHQIGRRGDQFWTLPKGHSERGETPEVAALRELQEETGITSVALQADQQFQMQYEFIHEGRSIDKTVTFYLGIVAVPATCVTMPEEIAAVLWCTQAEAVALASHEEVRRIIDAAFSVYARQTLQG